MKLDRMALALLGAAALHAQDVKVNALVEVWGTKMMSEDTRLNSLAKVSSSYYEGMSSGRFQEDQFAIKRCEIYLTGKITDTVSWNVMFDPNNSTSSVGNNVLQDAVVTWAPAPGLAFKVGQFKMPTLYEATMVAARDILFFDRNQLNRFFADKRDRGLWVSYAVGDPKGLGGKLNFAVSNGTSDDGSGGKNNDANAQKDYTFRFEGNYTSVHKFGLIHRAGETNLKTSTMVTGTIPAAWTTAGVTATAVLDNRDKTSLTGLYYAFDQGPWHAEVEYGTGLIGRRFPTLFASGTSAMGREHLDQKFAGYCLTGAYTMGRHVFLARYDMVNYNSGDDWYTPANPYLITTGASAGSDFSPKYSETVLGWNYLFKADKASYGKLKVDYIIRSKNFLAPRAGQTGEQGGDSLVASIMVAF